MEATFTKLADGAWGIKIKDPGSLLGPGQRVAVKKRSGHFCPQVLGELVETRGTVEIYRSAGNAKY